MSLLTKFLTKIGVDDFSQLSSEEKETFRSWESALNGRKLTDKDVETFLDSEINEVLLKLRNPEVSGRTDVFLKMKLEFIMKVKDFLNSPETEKAMMERNINSLL